MVTKHDELKKIFDACDWQEKHLDELPANEDEIRYAWYEEDAEYARPFFTTGLLQENTSAVQRGLYLGQDKSGAWKLCVREVTDSNFDPKDVARQIVGMMDISKVTGSNK
ncbi:MAG: hypothetical protein ACQES5_11130 [Thermodesulfobacteriota bacterium]